MTLRAAVSLILWAAVPASGQVPSASEIGRLEETAARSPGDYSAHERLGIAYLGAERLTDAFIAFHKALAVRPRAAEPYFYLGLIYFQRGILDQEIDAYRQALSRNPDHVGARLNVGHALLASGESDHAIDAYQAVLERDAGNLAALYNLGIIFAEAGDERRSRSYLERFLAVAPPSDPWRTAADSTLQEVVP